MSSILITTNDKITHMSKTLGDRIKRAREERGWNQQRLADAVGVSRSAVSQWESGETKGLKPDNLIAVAEVLRVTVPWLVRGEQIDTPAPATFIPAKTGGDDNALIVHVMDAAASMGTGRLQPEHDSVVGQISLSNTWVRRHLTITSPANLAVLSAYGDSMAPTFSDGDILLVDTGVTEIKLDAVYVLARREELFIKRVQRRIDGAFVIKSDNPLYDAYVVQDVEAEQLRILGRVVWAWNGKRL